MSNRLDAIEVTMSLLFRRLSDEGRASVLTELAGLRERMPALRSHVERYRAGFASIRDFRDAGTPLSTNILLTGVVDD